LLSIDLSLPRFVAGASGQGRQGTGRSGCGVTAARFIVFVFCNQ